MREPLFWWRPAGLAAGLLSPVAAIYGAIAASRMQRPVARATLPVICAGNFTLGGSGKTPAAMALAGTLATAGRKPALLSRGYGGMLAGPVRVDPGKHNAHEVGDEPLLLARVAPTIVSRDRAAGAKAAQTQGADVVVMDDGLQNASLAKDFTLAVVDGVRGIGNGRVFPAGPLRAPLGAQLACCDALLIVGDGGGAVSLEALARARGLPVFRARLVPDPDALAALSGRKVLAFAGIGDPEKFFATLAAAGVDAAVQKSFPDHHRYSQEEAGALILQAEREGLRLVTTEKDLARMSADDGLAALAARAHALPVTLKVAEETTLRDLVLAKIRA